MRPQGLEVRAVVLVGAAVLSGGLRQAPGCGDGCPAQVGQLAYGPVGAVAISERYAVFGSGRALLVADVSDLAAIRVVGEVVLPGAPQGIAIAGDHAYVTTVHAGLRVVDVSSPASPVEVGSCSTPERAVGIAAVACRVYVTDAEGVRAIDVSVPSAPIEVGRSDQSRCRMDMCTRAATMACG